MKAERKLTAITLMFLFILVISLTGWHSYEQEKPVSNHEKISVTSLSYGKVIMYNRGKAVVGFPLVKSDSTIHKKLIYNEFVFPKGAKYVKVIPISEDEYKESVKNFEKGIIK